MDRRAILSTLVTTMLTTTGALLLSSPIQLQPALAQSDDNRPRAPLSALLPATQKRLLMERAFNLSKNLMALDAARDDERTNKIVQELKTMVEEPDFDNPGFGKAAISMLTRRYQQDQTVLVQAAQSNILTGKNVRASFNIYTANLRFGEQYAVTAIPETKKAYIRANDGLPNVKQVISSDLDLRDLYRNQVQTKIDDVQAELYSENLDAVELNALLEQALGSTQLWFGMIADDNVQEAQEAVLAGKTLQYIDSKYEGNVKETVAWWLAPPS